MRPIADAFRTPAVRRLIDGPERDYTPAVRSAARSGTFDRSRVFNDAQMEAMSRLYGVAIYDVAEQTEAPWDLLSISQREAWEAWAKRLGNREKTPEYVRVWRFVPGAAARLLDPTRDADAPAAGNGQPGGDA